MKTRKQNLYTGLLTITAAFLFNACSDSYELPPKPTSTADEMLKLPTPPRMSIEEREAVKAEKAAYEEALKELQTTTSKAKTNHE